MALYNNGIFPNEIYENIFGFLRPEEIYHENGMLSKEFRKLVINNIFCTCVKPIAKKYVEIYDKEVANSWMQITTRNEFKKWLEYDVIYHIANKSDKKNQFIEFGESETELFLNLYNSLGKLKGCLKEDFDEIFDKYKFSLAPLGRERIQQKVNTSIKVRAWFTCKSVNTIERVVNKEPVEEYTQDFFMELRQSISVKKISLSTAKEVILRLKLNPLKLRII